MSELIPKGLPNGKDVVVTLRLKDLAMLMDASPLNCDELCCRMIAQAKAFIVDWENTDKSPTLSKLPLPTYELEN